jgi:hypothetical protein
MTLTISLMGQLELLAQTKLWSPASLKRNRGAVVRFGKMLGRNATAEDLTEDQIRRYAEDMTARGLADWTVDRDRMTLAMLARFVGGAE